MPFGDRFLVLLERGISRAGWEFLTEVALV